MQVDRTIIIGLLIVASLVMIFTLVSPEYSKMTVLQAQLAQKKAEYQAKLDYYSAIEKAHQEILARNEEIAKIDDALPNDPNLGPLIFYFQRTAKESGLLLKDLFLSKSSAAEKGAATTENLKDIVFSLDLLGDYKSLGRFINFLEKSARIFEVTNIAFGSTSGPVIEPTQSQFQIEQTYSFNLQVKTHSY